METSNRLLLDEAPLVIQPKLAMTVGLNEAIFLQLLHYWLQKSTNKIDGRAWVYNTYQGWKEKLPFFDIKVIQRIVQNLHDRKIVVKGNFNRSKMDKTTWYSIDYDVLDRLIDGGEEEPPTGEESPAEEESTEIQDSDAGGEGGDEAEFFEPDGYDVTFEKLFETYPDKSDKVKALRYWIAKNYPPAKIAEILDGVKWNIANNVRWREGYCPTLYNCLRNESYKDREMHIKDSFGGGNSSKNGAGLIEKRYTEEELNGLLDNIDDIEF